MQHTPHHLEIEQTHFKTQDIHKQPSYIVPSCFK
jgi:hypothetical protein